jgi:hypothetical protein
MAITRLTNWVDGQVLTAGDLNAEFNNIINNGTALISPLTANLNAGFNRITNLRLDGATAYTITTTSNLGRVAYHTVDGVMLLSQKTTGPFLPIGPTINQPTRVSGLIGSYSSNIGSFQANGYTLRTTTGLNFGVTATSSFSVNTQTAGSTENGRDQAAAFTSTSVHFYVIATGVGSTAPAGLVSSNPPPTGPTLPSSYIGWGYLGSVIYSPTSSMAAVNGVVTGSRTYLSNLAPPYLGQALTNTAALTSTPTNAGTVIPTIATAMDIGLDTFVGLHASTGGLLDVTVQVHPSSGAEHFEFNRLYGNSVSTVAGQLRQATNLVYHLPVLTNPPVVYYQFGLTAGTSASADLRVAGFYVPNGDVG